MTLPNYYPSWLTFIFFVLLIVLDSQLAQYFVLFTGEVASPPSIPLKVKIKKLK